MFYHIFLSPRLKGCAIITYKHDINEHETVIRTGITFKKIPCSMECVKVSMPAHQVLPLTAYIFKASYNTVATQANTI